MRFQIKKKFRCWLILDENLNTVAIIKNKDLLGPSKNILDAQKNLIFTTDKIVTSTTSHYVISQNDSPIATAHFKLPQSLLAHPKYAPVLPPVDSMQIDSPYGPFLIKRQPNNSLSLLQDDTEVGILSPFFTFHSQYLNTFTSYDPTFLASLYVLTFYMVHEDDILVV